MLHFYQFNDLNSLQEEAKRCQNCHLIQSCSGVVFGEGTSDAEIMLVGEGPGAKEDELLRPFVGPAGELLNKMLAAIEFSREEVYITNIVKCRPPNNRVPTQAEMNTCLPILRQQVRIINPSIIVLLGGSALKGLIDKNMKITKERGKWLDRNGILIMPTYHPAFLLRNPNRKRESWEDLKTLKAKYEEISTGGFS